jgi:hypothetical protein
MTAGTKTARSAPLPLAAAKKDQTPNAGFPGDFQDLFSFGMDQAIEIQKASLSTVVCLNSCAIDIYKNVFWFVPSLGGLFETAVQSFASCMELQLNWLNWPIPASRSAASPSSSAEALVHCMDIVIGERVTAANSTVESGSENSVAGGSGTPAQHKAEVLELETDMDIAIGARLRA